MTTIPEKKSEFVFIFGFMIVVALLVAWRAENAPLITTVAFGIAVGLAVLTIRWTSASARRMPWSRSPEPSIAACGSPEFSSRAMAATRSRSTMAPPRA